MPLCLKNDFEQSNKFQARYPIFYYFLQLLETHVSNKARNILFQSVKHSHNATKNGIYSFGSSLILCSTAEIASSVCTVRLLWECVLSTRAKVLRNRFQELPELLAILLQMLFRNNSVHYDQLRKKVLRKSKITRLKKHPSL